MRGNTGYQAPADGKLAAAIATIRDKRFPIRNRVERNRKLIRRIELSFRASIRNEINYLAHLTKMATAGAPVETVAKIAMEPPCADGRAVNLLSRSAEQR